MTKAKSTEPREGYREISIDMIDEPAITARLETMLVGMDELVDSIKQLGVLQPIVVTKVKNRYEIVAGHRRFEAAKLTGMVKIPAIVKNYTLACLEAAKMHENAKRTDINPLEEAVYFKRLIEEKGFKAAQICELLGRTKGYVSQRIAMFDYPTPLLCAVRDGVLKFSSARQLMIIKDPALRDYYIDCAIRSGANLTVVENWVAEANAPDPDEPPQSANGVTEDEALNVPVYKPQCFACGEAHDANDLMTMQLCKGCAKVISEATKEDG